MSTSPSAAAKDGEPSSRVSAATLVVSAYAFTILYALLWWYAGSVKRPQQFFNEGGAIDWLSGVYLATAAVLAWQTWCLSRRRRSPGAWFWLLSATGLTFLAIDERFMLHERLHTDWLRGSVGSAPLGLRNWNDAAVIAYGVLALAVFMFGLPIILRHRRFRAALAAGFGLYIVHTAIDSLFLRSPKKEIIEETFKLLSGASFVLAYMLAMIDQLRPGSAMLPQRLLSLGQMICFAFLSAGLTLSMLLGSDYWREQLMHGWGDPVVWLVSIILGMAVLLACMAWLTLRPGSRGRHLQWLVSIPVLAWLSWDAATVAGHHVLGDTWGAAKLFGGRQILMGRTHFPDVLPFIIIFAVAILTAVVGTQRFSAHPGLQRLLQTASVVVLAVGGLLLAPVSTASMLISPLLLVAASVAVFLAMLHAALHLIAAGQAMDGESRVAPGVT